MLRMVRCFWVVQVIGGEMFKGLESITQPIVPGSLMSACLDKLSSAQQSGWAVPFNTTFSFIGWRIPSVLS